MNISGETWDVVVVGAGPAGAMAARELARKGRRVLLLDKARFPRDKVCGSCLGGATLAALRSAGLGNLPAQLGGVDLRRLRLAAGNRQADIALPTGVAVSRRALDAALIDAAVSAGAEFAAETTVLPLKTSGTDFVTLDVQQGGARQSVRARIVVVADGLAGLTLANELPSVVRPGSRLGAGAVLNNSLDFFRSGVIFMACGRDGYVGLVRLEDGRLDIAAALDAEAVRRKRGPGRVIAGILSEQRDWPTLPEIVDIPWRGTPALTRVRTRPAGNRFFVLGDAAGYVEPFTGEGIGWAMHSALALGPIVNRAVDAWNARLIKDWSRKRRALLGSRQLRCRAMARLLRSPLLTRAMVAVLGRVPAVSGPFVNLLNRAPSSF